MPKTPAALPIPVKRALRKIGADIRDARRRRRLPMTVVADRAMITRQTLMKVERGNPSVGLGIYATVLFTLGLLDPLLAVADPGKDSVGLALEEERLPQRVHAPRGNAAP